MKYVSTRGAAPTLGFADVLLEGLGTDGGLYVPETWPALPPLDSLPLDKKIASGAMPAVKSDSLGKSGVSPVAKTTGKAPSGATPVATAAAGVSTSGSKPAISTPSSSVPARLRWNQQTWMFIGGGAVVAALLLFLLIALGLALSGW